ncbi:MAG: TIGR03619 family F420-dependent LLM class oxidoreductase [Mycobacterium sp.]
MNHPQLSVYLATYTDGPNHDWPATLAMAQLMDEAGVDRVVISDHVAFGEHFAAYGDPALGGTTGGRQPTGPDGAWLEPIAVLTAIAATTTRIRLGTSILLAALRRPAVLAKQLATLDVISAGRLDVGVGVGWQREEYEACGLSFEGRGRLLDHTLEVCTTLWTQQQASYDETELSFDNIHQMPKPVQQGGVPLWISGTVNRNVARRLARFGSGWIPWGPDLTDLRGSIPAMKQALSDAGGDSSGLQVQGAVRVVRDGGDIDYRATVAAVPDLVEAGVTDFRIAAPLPTEHDRATEVLAQLVDAFRDVTR